MDYLFYICLLTIAILFIAWIFLKKRNIKFIRQQQPKATYSAFTAKTKQKPISTNLSRIITIGLIIYGIFAAISVVAIFLFFIKFILIFFGGGNLVFQDFLDWYSNNLLLYGGILTIALVILVLIRLVYIECNIYHSLQNKNHK